MLYQIAVLIHLLAVAIWLGGALFLATVMVPLSRRQMGSPAQGARFLGHVARRFRPVAWVSIILMVASGAFLATDHWGVESADFFGGSGWFIRVLQAKVAIVALIVVLSFVHDFILGPRVARRVEESTTEGQRPSGRRALIWMARANVVLMLVVVALAVTLTRGSPFWTSRPVFQAATTVQK